MAALKSDGSVLTWGGAGCGGDSSALAAQLAGGVKAAFLRRVLPIFTDFYRFVRLSWETSTLKNYHPEDSEHSGSGRIEFSSKSTTFLM